MFLKRIIFLISIPLLVIDVSSQFNSENSNIISNSNINSFKSGEWFEYRIYYGVFNAGRVTISLESKTLNKKEVFHSKSYGRTVGLARFFFKVEDYYESYFDKQTVKPYKFIRDIYEGGYTKNTEILFNHSNGIAYINDKKNKKNFEIPFNDGAQDLISASYYLRNFYDPSKISVNESIDINMFFDNENYLFKLKFLGEEVLSTKFGKISSLKFRPYVQSGRVFREQESVTMWVSNDKNKVPLKIQANLAVGSIECDLENFKNLKYPFLINIE